MGRYDFDTIIDRRQTESVKWDRQMIKKVSGSCDALPFWVADMDFQSPPEVISALQRRIAHGVFGYPSAASVAHAVTAFCSWATTRHDWSPDPKSVIFSPGVISTLSVLVQLLTRPEEGVLIQTPAYQPFYRIIEQNGRQTVENPLIYDPERHRYTIDYTDLERKLSMPQTTLMIFCSPHNPAGRVWRREELMRVDELCRRYGVRVISDEIHADLTYPEYKHTPFSSLAEHAVTCMAPSKTFNIAGEHFSCTVIPDETIRETYTRELRRLSIGTPGILAMTAAEAAYTRGEPWMHELIAYLQDNLNMMDKFFREHIPELHLVQPEASFIAFIDCRSLLPYISASGHTGTLSRFFGIHAGVALHDGLWFGKEGNGFVRINFGTSRVRLLDALQSIASAVQRLRQDVPL